PPQLRPPATYPRSLHDALPIYLRIDLDELLPIIDTAEYLGLVAVKEGEISLTELGTKAHSSKIAERKKLVHARLETLEPFSDIADRKSTRLNSSHVKISYAVFC